METAQQTEYEAIEEPAYHDNQLVMRIQRFKGGGFEANVYWRSKDAYRHNPLGLVSARPPRAMIGGRREDACRRTKKLVRWRAREIQADRLSTFTTRETVNDPVALMGLFARFVRLYVKATGKPWPYVAVPEQHPSNPSHWHIHVATRGFLDLSKANPIWWRLTGSVPGGPRMGNIDVTRPKALTEGERSGRCARYIGKYISKSLGEYEFPPGFRFSRASQTELPEKDSLILQSENLLAALNEVCDRFKLSRGDIGVFFWPQGDGFFISCDAVGDSPPDF